MDKNDSPPEFKNIPPAYFASEDLAPGQLIATILAEDPDTIGTTTYSIQTEEPTPFSLDSLNGQLTLKEPLDRENISEYQVIIRADDGIQYTDVKIIVQVSNIIMIVYKIYVYTNNKTHYQVLHIYIRKT